MAELSTSGAETCLPLASLKTNGFCGVGTTRVWAAVSDAAAMQPHRSETGVSFLKGGNNRIKDGAIKCCFIKKVITIPAAKLLWFTANSPLK